MCLISTESMLTMTVFILIVMVILFFPFFLQILSHWESWFTRLKRSWHHHVARAHGAANVSCGQTGRKGWADRDRLSADLWTLQPRIPHVCIFLGWRLSRGLPPTVTPTVMDQLSCTMKCGCEVFDWFLIYFSSTTRANDGPGEHPCHGLAASSWRVGICVIFFHLRSLRSLPVWLWINMGLCNLFWLSNAMYVKFQL